MEGDTNTQGENLHNRHSEEELTLVIILIGLLGIAIFIWMVLIGDMSKGGSTINGINPQTMEQVVKTTEPIDHVTGSTTTIDYLGLVKNNEIGNYFVHPETRKTLYISSSRCENECLEIWIPYTGEKEHADGDFSTIQRGDTGEWHYTWLNKRLYTFSGDQNTGDLLGDGYYTGFSVARP